MHVAGGWGKQTECGGWAVVLTHVDLQKKFAGSEADTDRGAVLSGRAVDDFLAQQSQDTP